MRKVRTGDSMLVEALDALRKMFSERGRENEGGKE